MCPNSRQVREAAPTEGAGVWTLAGVDPSVDLERPRLAEALAAVGAGVRPSTRVHVEVDAQVAVRVERPATLSTQEAARLGGVLGALVLKELGGAGEGGGAVHAGVLRDPILLGVALLVPQELGTSLKRALAGEAGKRGRSLGGLGELGAVQAGGERTVVVMIVRVRLGEISALLVAQKLGTALETPMTAETGKGGHLGRARLGRAAGAAVMGLRVFLLLLSLAAIRVTGTARCAGLFFYG